MSSKKQMIVLGGVTLAVVAGASYIVYRKMKKNKKNKRRESKPIQLKNEESMAELTERILGTPAAKNWKRVGIKHHNGVNIPVFSLRTKDSCGVGEFLDLIPLVDWCAANGLDVIQVLPLNDTSPFDNSPFSPTSSFSLNPYLLSLRKLLNFDKITPEMSEIVEKLNALNSSDRVNWKEVRKLKNEFFWAYYDLPSTQDIFTSEDYKFFLEKNKYWLPSYSLFCVFKEKYESKGWEEWPEANLDFDDQTAVDQLLAKFHREIEFYSLLQYLAFKQMNSVKNYAEEKRVFLKGDIPFLVSKDSADVWRFKKYFRLDLSAGAPPDMYAADGQNWGLPLYNWSELENDNYQWWKSRLAVASQYFHIYRVDHIVGFYRVWGVPQGKKATEGHFEPADESVWIASGEKFLRVMLQSNPMLPIGEDLGTVPMEVRASLQRLGICGTKVIRWERYWDKKDKPYIPYDLYNGDSMTTVSTHDSDTLAQWWTDLQEESKAFCEFKSWQYDQDMPVKKREEILYDSHHTPSLFHINLLNEYLALDPTLVHVEKSKERINVPGKVEESNWSYRIVPNLEDVSTNETVKNALARVLAK